MSRRTGVRSGVDRRAGAGEGQDAAESFEALRPLLFSIAYRMLASVSEAEDIVQEAYLRWRSAATDDVRVESPKAFLSAVVTRLSIDHLRSARVRREAYVGTWLPEPLVTDHGQADPAAAVEREASVSMAFLLVLERLTPVERAVFLLHDVFAYGYGEIARIVERTEVNCRQIAARSRRHVQASRPRFDTTPEERDRLAARFFEAVTGRDIDGLVAVLAEDVAVYGDGGGKAPQWSVPIVGAARVAQLLAGVGGQMAELGIRFERRTINGAPGALLYEANGRLTNVFVLEIDGGKVRAVRSVINPDKLRHLGPVADVRALARSRTRRDA